MYCYVPCRKMFPNFDVKSIIFPNFGHGLFPRIAGKNRMHFSYTDVYGQLKHIHVS